MPLAKMAYNVPDHTYVLLAREPNSLEFGALVATLRFTVKEIDPSTGVVSLILVWEPLEWVTCF